MFKYTADLYNLAKTNIYDCADYVNSGKTKLTEIVSMAGSLHEFPNASLVNNMTVRVNNVLNNIALLKERERTVRNALGIPESGISSEGMEGFSVSPVLNVLTPEMIYEAVNEIYSANNPYGVGQTRVDALTAKFGADGANIIQQTINNGGVIPQYILDILQSDNNTFYLPSGNEENNSSINVGNEVNEKANLVVELSKIVLNDVNPEEKFKELQSIYGTIVASLVYDTINSGKIEVTDDLKLNIINSGILDKPVEVEVQETVKPENIVEIENPNKEKIAKEVVTENYSANVKSNYFSETTDERIMYAYNMMRNEFGYTDEGAKGLLANMINENDTLDPTRHDNTDGQAFGICQWRTPSRQSELFNYCEQNNLDPYSLDGQLRFADYELKNNYNNCENGKDYGKIYDQLTGNVERGYRDIAQNVCIYYESPSKDDHENNVEGLRRAGSESAAVVQNLIDANINVI